MVPFWNVAQIMRRYVSRHLSVRNHRSYLPLSSSDTQLDSAAPECRGNYARYNPDDIVATREDEDEVFTTQRDSSTGKRRWFHHLKRRKKRHHDDGDAVAGQQRAGADDIAASPCDELEVAVEASLNVVEPGGSRVVEPHGSLLTPCATRDDAELDLRALDLATTINKSEFYHHHRRHRTGQPLASRPARRFAICEELEREMIMENGMNLRKNRKNLVIRQVLHDLLLL